MERLLISKVPFPKDSLSFLFTLANDHPDMFEVIPKSLLLLAYNTGLFEDTFGNGTLLRLFAMHQEKGIATKMLKNPQVDFYLHVLYNPLKQTG